MSVTLSALSKRHAVLVARLETLCRGVGVEGDSAHRRHLQANHAIRAHMDREATVARGADDVAIMPARQGQLQLWLPRLRPHQVDRHTGCLPATEGQGVAIADKVSD